MKALLLLPLLILLSCGDDNFKKIDTLGDFRVLGIISSAPEVAPGASATLSLIVSDVNGGGRIISGVYVSCIDPGIALGAKVSCDHDPSAISGQITIDPSSETQVVVGNLYTGIADDVITVNVPVAILTGRSLREQFNGVGLITIFTFTVDGKEVSAFKRIVATNRGSLNTNPSGSSVLLNGAPIGAPIEKGDKLVAINASPETYQVMNVDGSIETRTEEFKVAWYLSQGNFDKPKSNINEVVEYLGRSHSSPSVVMAIIRDERGGLEVITDVQ
jgi:hypothetical protein